jgi:hypothetical protein
MQHLSRVRLFLLLAVVVALLFLGTAAAILVLHHPSYFENRQGDLWSLGK